MFSHVAAGCDLAAPFGDKIYTEALQKYKSTLRKKELPYDCTITTNRPELCMVIPRKFQNHKTALSRYWKTRGDQKKNDEFLWLNSVKRVLPPVWKGVDSKRKEYFLFWVDPFLEGRQTQFWQLSPINVYPFPRFPINMNVWRNDDNVIQVQQLIQEGMSRIVRKRSFWHVRTI